jgi:hypothetical protein
VVPHLVLLRADDAERGRVGACDHEVARSEDCGAATATAAHGLPRGVEQDEPELRAGHSDAIEARVEPPRAATFVGAVVVLPGLVRCDVAAKRAAAVGRPECDAKIGDAHESENESHVRSTSPTRRVTVPCVRWLCCDAATLRLLRCCDGDDVINW